MPHDRRDALARAALAEIPKLLTLQDRTPTSPTYGCFDRIYWHYRMIDFPCGMSQEFVLPLALVWSLDLPDNPYRGEPEIARWAEAGIRYAARAAHADGSCDDYYPYERAAGAAAFSLYACLEASAILGIGDDPEIAAFLKLRAHWLATHQESGQLSNHEALISACLARMAERYGADEWEPHLQRRLARLRSWQDAEGWFNEYGGADPGYLSLTIGLLADLDQRRPDLGLRGPIAGAVRFLATLVHPDGTVGGGYTSRGTTNFFPHGFEIAGGWLPEALALNDLALTPLSEGRQSCYADDHIIGHHLWSWMTTWAAWREARPAGDPLPTSTHDFQAAKLLVDVRGDTRLYCGWSRGAAFKLYRGDQLLRADTGPSLQTDKGRVAVTHLEGIESIDRGETHLHVTGRMAWAKATRLTPAKSIVLRVIMLTVGRFFPDLIRKLLQKLLVTGRKDAPYRYARRLDWAGGGWTLTDTITADGDWADVTQIGVGGFQTSTTTIMARLWAPEQLQPWDDWTDRIVPGAPLTVTRRLA
jgi:hypothetical protein